MARLYKFTKCNLRPLMLEKNLTFKELGAKLGVSFQQIQKYASGLNEMSLKVLLETCQVLDCAPVDIYPEIEIYDKGFYVKRTQREPQYIEPSVELSGDLGGELSDSKGKSVTNIKNITNNYYPNSSFISDFFGNIRILDINSKGALMFKVAISIIVINTLFYTVFRVLGYSYSPLGTGDHLSQLIWSWIVFTWPMSFILPLLIKHWLVYIITVYTFHGMLGIAYDYINVGDVHNSNQIDVQMLWIIKFVISLGLTIIYAYIAKKYLRGASKKENKNI